MLAPVIESLLYTLDIQGSTEFWARKFDRETISVSYSVELRVSLQVVAPPLFPPGGKSFSSGPTMFWREPHNIGRYLLKNGLIVGIEAQIYSVSVRTAMIYHRGDVRQCQRRVPRHKISEWDKFPMFYLVFFRSCVCRQI